MSTWTPCLPESAPFSPEQRAWLNGFLAALFSGTPAQPASLRFAVYFASQSGTAERLAKKMAKELKAQGHTAEVLSLEKIAPADIAKEENALFFASTYGDGEPPEGVRGFYNALFLEEQPSLKKLRYAVFCLGDKHYEHFCKFGIELDERLQSMGATRFLPRVESDVDVDAPFEQWKAELKPHLSHKPAESNVAYQTDHAHSPSPAAAAVPSGDEVAHTHTKDNPYHAVLAERVALTSDVSSKLTVHLSLAIEGSEVHYEPGDACGVLAENDPELVDEILSLVPLDPAAELAVPRVGAVPAREALLRYLQPTRLTRKMVQFFAEKGEIAALQALLPAEQGAHLDAFLYDRGLVDLLHSYPGVLATGEELVSILPRLAPRLYSISSSPAAHGREVHCTIAVVRYRSHNRERGGVASTMLGQRLEVGARVPIYIQPNKRFRLPSPQTPMIMIGPGTGIAPFRSFLHERRALGHSGRNWLFFGERSAATDFLYCRELRDFVNEGHLTRFDTAFSRDQAHKVYVQDRMLEQGAELWRWLQEGGEVFVCGDASRMAKDVDAALHTVAETHGGLDAERAREYIAELHEQRRYHRDVY